MSSAALSGRILAAVAAVSLMSSPALAATQTLPSSIDPMVALSLLGSSASRDALCGVSAAGAAGAVAAASAASATTTQAGPVQGCVLPVTDAPVAVVDPVGPAPVAVLPASSGGLSLGLPILLAAAGAAILAALTLFGSDDEDRSPLSPN